MNSAIEQMLKSYHVENILSLIHICKSGERREEYRQSVRDHCEGGKARRRGEQGTWQLFCPAQEGLPHCGRYRRRDTAAHDLHFLLLHAVSGRGVRHWDLKVGL